ncbi:hypothetical protein D3C86_1621900 [compost metagenome]
MGLNYLLIPAFGMQGAAVTQLLCFGLIALSIVVGAQFINPIRISWWRITISLVLGLVFGVVLFPAWASIPSLSLLLKFPVGILATLLIFRVVAPEFLLWAQRRLGVAFRWS